MTYMINNIFNVYFYFEYLIYVVIVYIIIFKCIFYYLLQFLSN